VARDTKIPEIQNKNWNLIGPNSFFLVLDQSGSNIDFEFLEFLFFIGS